MPPLYFDDISEGVELPPLVKQPTTLQLFRFSAAIWLGHRIHYDQEYARSEGHPDVLVQATLHGAFLIQLVQDWIGPTGRLRSISYSNRVRAVPGDTLTCRGRVERKFEERGPHLAECAIWEENQHGQRCALGRAVVELPMRRPSEEDCQ